jgi:hypothetical protein
MNFDRWMDDPRGGASVNLADPDLKQRQNHILKHAFDALEPDVRALMARIGMLSGAVGLDVLEALNPRRPDPPEAVAEPTPPWWMGKSTAHFSIGDDLIPRETREDEIDEAKAVRQRHYESECGAFEHYQSALVAWRQSPATRAASHWLHDTLKDLEARLQMALAATIMTKRNADPG